MADDPKVALIGRRQHFAHLTAFAAGMQAARVVYLPIAQLQLRIVWEVQLQGAHALQPSGSVRCAASLAVCHHCVICVNCQLSRKAELVGIPESKFVSPAQAVKGSLTDSNAVECLCNSSNTVCTSLAGSPSTQACKHCAIDRKMYTLLIAICIAAPSQLFNACA